MGLSWASAQPRNLETDRLVLHASRLEGTMGWVGTQDRYPKILTLSKACERVLTSVTRRRSGECSWRRGLPKFELRSKDLKLLQRRRRMSRMMKKGILCPFQPCVLD